MGCPCGVMRRLNASLKRQKRVRPEPSVLSRVGKVARRPLPTARPFHGASRIALERASCWVLFSKSVLYSAPLSEQSDFLASYIPRSLSYTAARSLDELLRCCR